jgi:hypothetical protein
MGRVCQLVENLFPYLFPLGVLSHGSPTEGVLTVAPSATIVFNHGREEKMSDVQTLLLEVAVSLGLTLALLGSADAQCKQCRNDGAPCPAGNAGCTSDIGPTQFGGTECSQIPGCPSQTFTNNAATCGAGEFSECGPLGACCRPDGSCVQATQNLCEADGLYAGDGTVCGAFACPVVGGACCSRFSGSCVRKTEAFCEAFGSFGGDYYLGDGSVCEDGVCGCCQCTCDGGPSCVPPRVVGGCVTACDEVNCSFKAGATGDFCASDAECVRRQIEGVPMVSWWGLFLATSALLLVGALAALKRRRA